MPMKRDNEAGQATGQETLPVFPEQLRILSSSPLPRLFTDEDVCTILNISRPTLTRLMHHPVLPIPYIKFYTLLRFDLNDVDTWLQEWKKYSLQQQCSKESEPESGEESDKEG